MTVAPERTELPVAVRAKTLMDLAELTNTVLPGHRSEILEGQLIVTPAASGVHARSLSRLMQALDPLMGGETDVVQAVGLWLTTGREDHAIPDLAVVDEDFEDHELAYNCYPPSVFRMVVEITSSNWRDDLERKPTAYAAAGVPVYVIVDRRHENVIVLTDPVDDEYRTRSEHRAGESFVFPESIGAKIEIEVDLLLNPARAATNGRGFRHLG
ncbi:Uma2 family endonuclease [Streptomyces carpaticus]|uniref:Endonuclease, Uma2 family (Restriction endonuclease fold) n=2 Tax=Streptomyces TaxID=1883 RepID=A0A1I6VAP2_9ACTN|nr:MULTISPECIES: Uma2 family endonuclease [Streptomyces]QKV69413.1 Uma2 family endonuclease [Streptomyces harbinensis]UWM49440.1 Uma2 family endonuclease [Streptomyces carpaticus]SFT10808.1 Endonuclease, Uma2 family (restriction endonuclease fold) [Streptomyces harbinensis]